MHTLRILQSQGMHVQQCIHEEVHMRIMLAFVYRSIANPRANCSPTVFSLSIARQ